MEIFNSRIVTFATERTLRGIEFTKIEPMILESKHIGLYVHTPFDRKKRNLL